MSKAQGREAGLQARIWPSVPRWAKLGRANRHDLFGQESQRGCSVSSTSMQTSSVYSIYRIGDGRNSSFPIKKLLRVHLRAGGL